MATDDDDEIDDEHLKQAKAVLADMNVIAKEYEAQAALVQQDRERYERLRSCDRDATEVVAEIRERIGCMHQLASAHSSLSEKLAEIEFMLITGCSSASEPALH
jgi:hypothetical protein